MLAQGPTNCKRVLTPKTRTRKRKEVREAPGMKFQDLRKMFEKMKKEKNAKED